MRLVAPDASFDEISAADTASFWRTDRHDSLECLTATFRTHVFPPHTHESYVIGTVVGGMNVYRISGSLVRAGPGELCFVNPGEVHDAIPEDEGYSYRMIYPKPSLLQSIVSSRRAGARPRLTFVCQSHPIPCWPAASSRRTKGCSMVRTPWRRRSADLRAARHDRPSCRRTQCHGHSRARACSGQAGQGFSLGAFGPAGRTRETLAREAGLSAFHLIRVFRKATGLTPHNWLLDRRVHQACNLLRDGLSATHVAAMTGFSDQSHLTRVFKQRLGVTPGRFREWALP